MYCVDCGNQLQESNNYCVSCGNLINNDLNHSNHRDTQYQNNYLVKHWLGQLSLAQSYWVNNVLAGLVLFALMFTLNVMIDFTDAPKTYHLIMVILWISVLIYIPWMLIGLWRSACNYKNKKNKKFWGYIVKFLVIFGWVQNTIIFNKNGYPQLVEHTKIILNIDSIPPYDLMVIENGTELIISGGIKYGLTDEVKTIFQNYPNIIVLHLNSWGGRVWESQKLAKFIKNKQIVTYTAKECYSACVDIFVVGKHRFIKKTANLGFHKPSFPGMDDSDLKEAIILQEQFYYQQGVNKSFIKKAFSVPSDQLWKPSNLELLEANVVTRIVE